MHIEQHRNLMHPKAFSPSPSMLCHRPNERKESWTIAFLVAYLWKSNVGCIQLNKQHHLHCGLPLHAHYHCTKKNQSASCRFSVVIQAHILPTPFVVEQHSWVFASLVRIVGKRSYTPFAAPMRSTFSLVSCTLLIKRCDESN